MFDVVLVRMLDTVTPRDTRMDYLYNGNLAVTNETIYTPSPIQTALATRNFSFVIAGCDCTVHSSDCEILHAASHFR